MSQTLLAALLALTLSSALASAQSHASGDLRLEPYSFRTYDGSTHPAELGHLQVMQDRADPARGLIDLGFVRLRSTAQKPRSPIVFLPGGPGIPGTVLGAVPVYFGLLEKLQAEADVILFGQRGIGTSLPNTACPEAAAPPPDVFAKEENFRKALVARAIECAAFWRAKGASLESFSTAESAEDLEDLRRALAPTNSALLRTAMGPRWRSSSPDGMKGMQIVWCLLEWKDPMSLFKCPLFLISLCAEFQILPRLIRH